MAIISFLMWLGRGKAEEKLEKLVQADNKLLVEKLTLMCFHHGGFSRLLRAVRYQWLAEGTTEKRRKIASCSNLLLCLKLLVVKAELVRAFKSICSPNLLKSSVDFQLRPKHDLLFHPL